MLEQEKKVILTPVEYDALLNRMNTISVALQNNYYFDTENYSMNLKGITCRIREKDGIYKAIIKMHIDMEDSSIEIGLESRDHLDQQVFIDKGLSLQGTLKTIRTVIFKNEYIEAVLDRNVYLDTEDHELEIEYFGDNEQYANDFLIYVAELLLSQNVIERVEEFIMRGDRCKSKSERFFDRKIKIQKGGDLNGLNFRRNQKNKRRGSDNY